MSTKRRLVIGMTGATGAVYTVRLLQVLQSCPDVETHLVISPSGVLNIKYELDIGRHEIQALADQVHSFRDVGATLASGSFPTAGMVIVPCSMRTLAAVAHGLSDNLITRAADVTLKERRRLVMMVRETPFNLAHLRNMTAVTEMGGIIFPPMPAFYLRPNSIDDIVDHTVMRVLELFDIQVPGERWDGSQKPN
ncbi:UbiX family flavin prenyltransferase [Alcaligenes faecalis]|uniref:Flavin prenyltransferase UbiX n=2 Tax=Alcaligenes faecalis TaxID=511 RepID=A0A2U2BIQ7_ALCFA|nr:MULTISPECIES: UbiX family flavin prenyltransferase [Alcaligenes]MDK7584498.1 UbiX family flavin prenyltransferase [Alcaligenes phenolicus]ATI01033.1 3-octaprenyl-4-hydroxybenzoate carboxy-lyase [Alcaligenes faecalis]AYZ90392.1 UbiX family flavin prenyltransferase [Alcaligenes faecalis]KAA1288017.1 UbiX family flavin prenyltransferase [Alcaligenes faecalis]MBH0309004.1 UbiX family flavin prenyltransferase [Alcaligenes faecalis]